MKNVIFFHDKCLVLLIVILRVVLACLLVKYLKNGRGCLNLEKKKLEIRWTLLPTLLIILLVVPSLELLYFSEEGRGGEVRTKIKIIGHQ